MSWISRKMQYELLATGSAILVAWAIRKGMSMSWKAIRKEGPPQNPAAYGTEWEEALSWAAITGLTTAMVRVLVKRVAAQGWLKLTGTKVSDLED